MKVRKLGKKRRTDIRHGASKGHFCYPLVFLTYLQLPMLNFLLPFTSSILVGYYPTLAPLLVTIVRMLSTFCGKKLRKKPKKSEKGNKISEALFFSQSHPQTRLQTCLYRTGYCVMYLWDTILVLGAKLLDVKRV